MTSKNQKLNSLLNYRFVKKTVPKLDSSSSLSDSDNSQNSQSLLSGQSSTNTNVDQSKTSPYEGIFGSPLQKSNSTGLDHLSCTKLQSQDSDATVLDSQGSSQIDSQGSSQIDSQGSSQNTILYYSQGQNSKGSAGYLPDIEPAETPPSSSTPSQQTVAETPITSPESPIFKPKQRTGKIIIVDDSEDVPSSSTASSPWLSKENGITNGITNTSTIKQRRKEKLVVREEYQGNEESLTQEQECKVEQLRQMFPSQLKTSIIRALTEAQGDTEKAVDLLIDGRVFSSKPKPKKRVIRLLSSDSEEESSKLQKPSKRMRVLSDEKNTDTVKSPSLPRAKEEKVKYLQEAFPKKGRRIIYKVLENNDWDVSKATEEVTNDDGKQEALDDEDKDFDSEDEGADSDDSLEELQQDSSINTMVVSFFNDATRDELATTPGCSKKKADVILSLRPFSNYHSMVEVFQDNKAVGLDVIRGCMEIIRVREVIVRLMQRCEKISKDMENVVSYLTTRSELDENDDDDNIRITKQPSLISERFKLKPFQMVGLNWLRIMHTQQLNGILADEMGLGKTIQTIAFIAHLLEEGEDGPHLVVVPSSTIENWMREFQDWCPDIDVLVYYGSQEERRYNRQSILYENRNDFNVILTTYNMATGSVEDRALFKRLEFHYAIFDEGHMLKNMSSLRYQNLMKINAERRLLLTGTPLQNNLLELMSLLSFVMPDIFMGKTDQLKRMFSMISKGNDDKSRSRFESERIMHAKRIMKPFVLRRLKSEVQKQLPQKTEVIEYCELLPDQREVYDRLVANFSAAIADDSVRETRGASMLMQLRKAANHPLLIRNHFSDDVLQKMAKKIAKEPSHRDRGALPDLICEDMAQMNDYDLMRLCDQYKKYVGGFKPDTSVIGESGKFRKLEELLKTHKSQGDRVLIFSQFTMLMDVMEEFLKQRHYIYMRMDGSTPVPDRQDMIDKFTKDDNIFIFMLSTRAGGLGINLIAANVVIIHDIDFNPYNDKQAEDRCHRVGQTREVKIIRMISKGTVEEGILNCAREKLKLEKDVTTAEDLDKENLSDVASLLRNALTEKKV